SFLKRSTPDDSLHSEAVVGPLDASSLADLLAGLHYRPCPQCPSFAVRSVCDDGRQLFSFSYHFNNLKIGQRLTVNVNFTDPTDINGCESVSYFVSSGNCVPVVPTVGRRCYLATNRDQFGRRRLIGADALLDTLMYLNRTEVEKCQLLSRVFFSTIERGSASLPLRQMALIEIFTFVRSVPLADLAEYVSKALKCCWTPRLILCGQLTQLVASDFLGWKYPFAVDEIAIGKETNGSVSDVQSTVTHACDRWKTAKLRYLATQHCERVMEPTIVQRLTCLELELPNIGCREALEQLLFHSPHIDLRLIFPYATTTAEHYRMWQEFMKSTVEPRLLAGDTQTFVRSLWIRCPDRLLDLCGYYANYSGILESGGKCFYVYNVGSPENPLTIYYAWYTDQDWRTRNSMRYYFVIPGRQECDRSFPFKRDSVRCRHDFAGWIIPDPSSDPRGGGWHPTAMCNHPEWLEWMFPDYAQ
ncbi:hypothetical protein AAVH_30757, partial [Aphelenchoides avenae]